MQTPSQVESALAWIVSEPPPTPEGEGYRQILTQATNHLLPLVHPEGDLHNHFNDRHDTWSDIISSRACLHEKELRRQEDYDQDHSSSRWGTEGLDDSTTDSTTRSSACWPARNRLQNPRLPSPPRDQRHNGTHGTRPQARGIFGVSASPRDCACFIALLILSSPTSTNTKLRLTLGQLAGRLHNSSLGCQGHRRRHDGVPPDRDRAGHTSMALPPPLPLHQPLGELLQQVCLHLSIAL